MTKTLILIFFPFLFASAPVEKSKKGTLVLKVEGIKEVKGNLGLLVFNQAEGFPEEESKAILSREIKVTASEMKVELEDLPFGTYAFSLVHDVNANKMLDKNLVGIPKEPFGFSQNKSIYKGLPSFEEAGVTHTKKRSETVIKMVELF